MAKEGGGRVEVKEKRGWTVTIIVEFAFKNFPFFFYPEMVEKFVSLKLNKISSENVLQNPPLIV